MNSSYFCSNRVFLLVLTLVIFEVVVNIKKKGGFGFEPKKKKVFSSSRTKQNQESVLKSSAKSISSSHASVSPFSHPSFVPVKRDRLSGSRSSGSASKRSMGFEHLQDSMSAHSAAVSTVNHYSNIIFEFVHDHLLYVGFMALAASIYLFVKDDANYSIIFFIAMAIIVLQSITLLSEWLFDESRIKRGIVSPIPIPHAVHDTGSIDATGSIDRTAFSRASGSADRSDGAVLDPDVFGLLNVVDELLGKLPDDEIERFVKSPEFRTYEKVMDKYRVK
jgi:hypothetical protein